MAGSHFPALGGAHATRTKYSSETTCPFRPRHCGYTRTLAPQVTQDQWAAVEEQVIWRYVVAGSAWWEAQGSRTRVLPGTVLATRQPTRGQLILGEGGIDVLWIVLQGPAGCAYFDQITRRFGPLHRIPRESETVNRALELVRAARRNTPRSPFFWSDQAYLWLSAWHRELDAHYQPLRALALAAPEDKRLRLIAPRRVKNFAAQMGYSPGYFTRLIGRAWKQTPGRVLRRVRLEESARLLRDSGEAVGSIAATVGYASVPAFITAFKRKYGCTPLVYRRNQL